MTEKINFEGWPNCIRLFNAEIELIITTDIGPRIVRMGFISKQNFFYLAPEHAGKTGGSEWKIYGGHRLWLAPEEIDLSYYPDNDPVSYRVEPNSIKVTQSKEITTGIVKEMEVSLLHGSNRITVLHRLINQGTGEIEVAPWAISALAGNGRAIIPQEPFGEGNEYLLPARSLALWQYTKMNDPRWSWGEKYIQAHQNPAHNTEQKIGILNKQGWCAYALNGELLIKKFPCIPGALYPDYMCNNEVYINENLLEIETLGPLTKLQHGASIEHVEHWLLTKAQPAETDEDIDSNILPLINTFLELT
ncbi:MAG: hypothetical protein ABI707_07355 [Ferruginibacter sp.]